MQAGLALADAHKVLAQQLADAQQQLSVGSRDVETLFKRLQQLEARQVELANTRDAKFDARMREQQGKLSEVLQLASALESKVDRQLSEQECKLRESTEELRHGQSGFVHEFESLLEGKLAVDKELQQKQWQDVRSACEALSQRVKGAEVSVQGLISEQKGIGKLRELHESTASQLDCVSASVVAQREQSDLCVARVSDVERCTRQHAAALDRIFKALEQQAVAAELQPLSRRVAVVEEECSAARARFQEAAEAHTAAGVRLDELAAQLEVTERQHREAAQQASARFAELREDVAAAQELLQRRPEAQAADSAGVNPVTELSTEICRLKGVVEDMARRQDRCDDDVNKFLRLARIMDAKVESFDEVEQRMEELSQHARRLIGAQMAASTRCLLSCASEAAARSPRAAADGGRQCSGGASSQGGGLQPPSDGAFDGLFVRGISGAEAGWAQASRREAAGAGSRSGSGRAALPARDISSDGAAASAASGALITHEEAVEDSELKQSGSRDLCLPPSGHDLALADRGLDLAARTLGLAVHGVRTGSGMTAGDSLALAGESGRGSGGTAAAWLEAGWAPLSQSMPRSAGTKPGSRPGSARMRRGAREAGGVRHAPVGAAFVLCRAVAPVGLPGPVPDVLKPSRPKSANMRLTS